MKLVGSAERGTRWSDLNHLLVQLSESHSIRSKVVCPRIGKNSRAKGWATFLLPEIAQVEYGPFDETGDPFELWT